MTRVEVGVNWGARFWLGAAGMTIRGDARTILQTALRGGSRLGRSSAQEFEAISGVCSFRRSPRPVLDDASFREAHQAEAAQWYFGLAAHIQWRIYGSRSY